MGKYSQQIIQDAINYLLSHGWSEQQLKMYPYLITGFTFDSYVKVANDNEGMQRLVYLVFNEKLELGYQCKPNLYIPLFGLRKITTWGKTIIYDFKDTAWKDTRTQMIVEYESEDEVKFEYDLIMKIGMTQAERRIA